MMYPYPFFGFPSYRRYYKAPFSPNNNYMNNKNDYSNSNLNQNINISTNTNRNSYNSSFRNKSQNNNQNQNNKHNNNENNYNNANQYKLDTNLRNNTSTSQNLDSDEEFFDFFGIRLASDELLILALLFFLYKEEAKDPYLYISLLLLLLS